MTRKPHADRFHRDPWVRPETPEELVNRFDDPSAHEQVRQVLRYWWSETSTRNGEAMSVRALAEKVFGDKIDPTTLYRFMSGDGTLASRTHYVFVVRTLFDRGMWHYGTAMDDVLKIPDALFFALRAHFDVNDAAIKDVEVRTPGTYLTWRRSILLPDRYTVGKMTIWRDAKTGATKVEEEFRFTSPDMTERYDKNEGYLFRMNLFYVMLMRDVAINQIKLVILESYRDGRSPKSVHSFVGTSMGYNGHRIYASKAYMERRSSDEQLDGHLGVVTAEAVPAPVRLILGEQHYVFR